MLPLTGPVGAGARAGAAIRPRRGCGRGSRSSTGGSSSSSTRRSSSSGSTRPTRCGTSTRASSRSASASSICAGATPTARGGCGRGASATSSRSAAAAWASTWMHSSPTRSGAWPSWRAPGTRSASTPRSSRRSTGWARPDVLFPARTLDAIAAGEVTLAFRRWRKYPRVRAGTRMRTRVGLVEVVAVEPVTQRAVTPEDARRAGVSSVKALISAGRGRPGALYRVELRFAGPDPRIELRERAELSADELERVLDRLARMDAARDTGPWTRTILELIAAHPAKRAPDLAASLHRETAPFKRDVRKLKELGLTESLEIGYRLSPRGRVVLDALEAG